MKRRNLLLSVLLALCFVVSMSFSAWGAQTIKIGVIGPMNFMQGKGHWNGATMAMEEINAKGGVKVGKKKMKIELVKADSNEFLNVTDATNAMELLLTRHKVDFIVGGFRTEAVLAMQDIAMDYKKIFIGCGAAHPELCERVAKDYKRYKYFFRGTPFNSRFLVKTCFIQMATVGGILKKYLGIPQVKVAIAAEKAMWVDPMIKAAQGFIPKMGMEVVGIWRPSAVATDLTAELSAIQRSGAHMIFTTFSSSVGIAFARQAGELKVPAVQVGINVEAQKDGFWEATQQMGNYVMTMNTYARDVEYNELTKPFIDQYIQRFGEVPTYTVATYDAIVSTLVPVIEKAGTLNADKLVVLMENREPYKVASGTIAYIKDAEGRPLHDLKWGPGFLTSLGVQWQDGKLVGVWPYKWKPTPDGPEVTYKGIVPYKIPPWVVEAYKK
ncbi:MAG: ABC transporter substrate-binding protein [Deltaproteobacteria bacterium]|nr:MAG: ABC transporter substrate-binding protein [Deltaproteobacteria bacterium]